LFEAVVVDGPGPLPAAGCRRLPRRPTRLGKANPHCPNQERRPSLGRCDPSWRGSVRPRTGGRTRLRCAAARDFPPAVMSSCPAISTPPQSSASCAAQPGSSGTAAGDRRPGTYIAPITGIAGTIVGYWFGSGDKLKVDYQAFSIRSPVMLWPWWESTSQRSEGVRGYRLQLLARKPHHLVDGPAGGHGVGVP